MKLKTDFLIDSTWNTSGRIEFEKWRDTKRPLADYAKLYLMQEAFKAGRLSVLKEIKKRREENA
ncbi:MAG: hypothetical protein ACD_86C00003G0015 [uncultured bacterium]|nr:MAG: hypothetical protein ACD_86C00003G0015 [uncultured bacterium]